MGKLNLDLSGFPGAPKSDDQDLMTLSSSRGPEAPEAGAPLADAPPIEQLDLSGIPDALEGQEEEQPPSLADAYAEQPDIDPDRLGKAIHYAERAGMDPREVYDSPEMIKRAETLPPHMGWYEQFYPVTAKIMKEDIKVLALAGDDPEQMGKVEETVKQATISEAWGRGVVESRAADLGWKELMGVSLTPEEQTQLEGYLTEMNQPMETGFIGAAAKMAPMMLDTVKGGLEKGISGAMGAGTAILIAGNVGPQAATPEEAITLPVGMGAAFTAGSITGTTLTMAAKEAGLAWLEFKEFKDPATGEKIDPQIARIMAGTVGMINGLIETLQLKGVAKWSGLNKLVKKSVMEATKKALKSTPLRKTLLGLGKFEASETGQEVLQEITNVLGGELAKEINDTLYDTDIPADEINDIVDRLVATAKESAKAFLVMGMPGAARTYVQAGRGKPEQVARPPIAPETLDKIIEDVQQTKLYQRAPEVMAEHVEQLRAAHGLPEILYLPPGAVTEAVMEAPPDQIARVLEDLGITPEDYAAAVEQGTDLPVPLARGITVAADKNNKPIREALRSDPSPPPARPLTDMVPTKEDVAHQKDQDELDEWATAQAEDLAKQGYSREWAESSMALAKEEMRAWGSRFDRPPLDWLKERPLEIGIEGQEKGEGKEVLHQPAVLAPPFYSQMQNVATDKLPGRGSAHQMAQTLRSWAKKGMFKQEELEWSGVLEWLYELDGKVSKEEVLEFIEANRIRVEEVEASPTKWESETMEGGENYRELLLTWRPEGSQEYRSIHWREPNVIVHVRFNEREDDGGNRVLFIEEIQSDLHQEGRQKGYKETPQSFDGVMDAPFKSTSSWAMLAFKRIVRWAAENGYDSIAWTPGEVQAERYDMSKRLDRIEYEPVYDEDSGEPVGKYDFIAYDKNGQQVVTEEEIDLDRVETLAGKEIAEKIHNHEGEERADAPYRDWRVLSGLDLKVGDKGMKGFYDKILPKAVGKYVKKWGGKVGTSTIREKVELIYVGGYIDDNGIYRDYDDLDDAVKIDQGDKLFEAWSLPLTDKMKKAALEVGQPLFQPQKGRGKADPNSYRGAVIFGDKDARIILSKLADGSTLPHELFHVFLKDMDRWAQMPEAPAQVKADYEMVRAWLGAKPGEALTEAQQEKFALGGEKYLAEGRAPSQELMPVFERLRAWILDVYKSLRGINVKLSDEIRGVFDRLLATDEEIEQVRAQEEVAPLYETPPEGMDPAVYAQYRDIAERAKAAAAKNVMENRIEALNQARRLWREEARELAENDPVQQAMAQIIEAGGLNLDELHAEYEPGVVRSIRTAAKGLATKKGTLPLADAAAMLGLEPEALADQLASAPTKTDLIKGYVAEKEAEWKDTLTPAEAALTDEYLDMLGREIQLAMPGMGVLPTREVKRQIRAVTGQTKIGEINVKWVREEKALEAGFKKTAAAARKALKEGKRQALAKEKARQRDLAAKRRERTRTKKAVDRMVKFIARVQKSKSLPPEYLEWIADLVEPYDLHRRTKKTIERRESLLEYVNRAREEGETVNIPDHLLSLAEKKTLNQMTFEELEDVHDAVKNLAHLGYLKTKLLNSKRARDIEEAEAEMIAEAAGRRQKKPPRVGYGGKERNLMERGLDVLHGISAQLLKIENIIRHLDGFKAGPFFDYLFAPIKAAEDDAFVLGSEVAGRMESALGRFSTKERRTWHRKKIKIPGVPDMLTKEQAIMIALNSGNKGNIEALNAGLGPILGWEGKGTEIAAVWEYLNDDEVALVKEIWDILDSLWPRLKETHEAVAGAPLPKVEGVTIRTQRHGDIEGQYFPLVFNRDLSLTADKHEVERQAKEAHDLFAQKYYGRPSTRARATHERKGGKLPPRLDFGVIYRHLGEVVHDITHRAAVRDVATLIQRDGVREAIEGVVGEAQYRQLMPWLENIVRPKRDNISYVDQAFGHMRKNTTAVMLGLKVTVALKQCLSLTQTIDELGMGAFLKGLASFYAHPWEMKKQIDGLSTAMAQRRSTWNRELYEMSLDKNIAQSLTGQARDAFFWAIGMMDQVATYPTWQAAYNQAVYKNGLEGQEAVDFADSVVRRTQPTASPKDLAAIQRGGEIQKSFTMFYTFFSVFHNRFYEAHSQVRELSAQGEKGQAAVRLFRAYWWLLILPAYLGQSVNERRFLTGPGEIAKSILGYYLAGLPFIRDWISPVLTGYDYQASPTFEYPEAVGRLAGYGLKQIADEMGGDELEMDPERMAKMGIEVLGYAFGLPSKQAIKTMEGLLSMDEAEGPLDAAGRLAFGRHREREED